MENENNKATNQFDVDKAKAEAWSPVVYIAVHLLWTATICICCYLCTHGCK